MTPTIIGISFRAEFVKKLVDAGLLTQSDMERVLTALDKFSMIELEMIRAMSTGIFDVLAKAFDNDQWEDVLAIMNSMLVASVKLNILPEPEKKALLKLLVGHE